jgi:[protein-PII] uridylyltransferase
MISPKEGGGDHSELGAIEVEAFSKRHRLPEEQKQCLIWLVKNHLLMSQTAQRQDIYDLKTIQHFCEQLPKQSYLDYLYILTVADICATNSTLWNAWKDSLLKELYYAALNALNAEKKLLDEQTLVEQRREQALNILVAEDIDKQKVLKQWKYFKAKYFLHESPEIIARHTKAILATKSYPLVMIMPHHSQGGTEVFIYMPHNDKRFTITTTILNNHHVTIQEATILTCDNQFDLDTYIVLDERDQAILSEQKIVDIKEALETGLRQVDTLPNITTRRISRIQAHFNIKPDITFSEDKSHHFTQLFLVAADRPGLLAHISQVLLKENIHLHSAKIATAGERVEDTFQISTQDGKPLNHKQQMALTRL